MKSGPDSSFRPWRDWFQVHRTGGWHSVRTLRTLPTPDQGSPAVKLGITAAHTDLAATEPRRARKRISNIVDGEWIAVLQTVGFFFFLMKEATTGVGDRQGGLACCSPWGRKSQTRLSDRTELNWKKHQNNKQHKLQNKTQTENNYPKFQHKNKQSNNIKTNGTYNPGLGPPRGGTRRCLVCWGWGILAGSPEGNGNPLQYSCLENSMDRGAWRATVSAVTESRTQQHTCLPSHQGFPSASDSKESTSNVGDTGLIPGSGRSPGGGNGNPLQCSCLGNPMDRGARRITVHGIAKSRTQLRD